MEQELQADLGQIMELRLQSAEYQLSYYPPNGSQYVRHRDAFPDDGSETNQRRVTGVLYLNPGWRREDGGKLRLWLPQDSLSEPSSTLGRTNDLPNGTSSLQHQASLASTVATESDLPNGHVHFSHPGHAQMPNGHVSHEVGREFQNGVLDPVHHSGVTRDGDGLIPDGHLNGFGVNRMHGDGHYDGQHHPDSPTHYHSPAASIPEDGSAMSSDLHAAQNGTSITGNSMPFEHGQQYSRHFYSPGSINGSLVVEPTEASSIQDNASVDGSSVRSYGRRSKTGAEDVEVGTAAVLDVAPVAGRLVLFLSGAVEHAVLPNFSDRAAITIWCQ